MSNPSTTNPQTPETQPAAEATESFGEIFAQYQKSHSRKAEGSRQIDATVISVTADSVFFDIGYKSEGILPVAALQGQTLKPGDKVDVTYTESFAVNLVPEPSRKANTPTGAEAR